MPEKETIQRAHADKRAGKSASTQAGEFVREEMHHIREGKHGARSTKQAIAIGLSKARRAGVDLPPPKKGKTSERTRKSAARAYARGHGAPPKSKPSAKRSKAIQGSHLLVFNRSTTDPLTGIKELLRKEGLAFYSEVEVEVMLRHRSFVALPISRRRSSTSPSRSRPSTLRSDPTWSRT